MVLVFATSFPLESSLLVLLNLKVNECVNLSLVFSIEPIKFLFESTKNAIPFTVSLVVTVKTISSATRIELDDAVISKISGVGSGKTSNSYSEISKSLV